MKILSVKDVIGFRKKSERGKKTFIDKMKLPEKKKEEEKEEEKKKGGDYWVSCVSAISSSFKVNDLIPILNRKEELEKKYAKEERKGTKDRYKRNIDILSGFEDCDFKKWRPKKMQLLKQTRTDTIMVIKGIEVKATPQYVFTFQRNGVDEVGAIWFIAKVNGFKTEELGMFADIQFKYLKKHFSKGRQINSNYCIAVDVFRNTDVSYSELEKGEVTSALTSTLAEIKKLME